MTTYRRVLITSTNPRRSDGMLLDGRHGVMLWYYCLSWVSSQFCFSFSVSDSQHTHTNMNAFTNRRIFHQIHAIFSLISVISNHSIFFIVQHSVSPHLLLFMNSSIRLRPRSSYPPSLFPSVNHGTLILLLTGDVELNPGPSLNFTHLNIRSIRSFQKSSSLHNYLADHPTEIISLNETWLQPTDSDNFVSSLAPPGYSILHSPRLTGQGGGLALIFRSFLKFKLFCTRNDLNLSNLWLLNFQLATSIVLHLPKYLLFFRNSRTYSKFLFHHRLSSSSVVTSISMLTLI